MLCSVAYVSAFFTVHAICTGILWMIVPAIPFLPRLPVIVLRLVFHALLSCFLQVDMSAALLCPVLNGFPKGRLLACKRWPFTARKDTFCTLKGHLLENAFSVPFPCLAVSRRGRAEPCPCRALLLTNKRSQIV